MRRGLTFLRNTPCLMLLVVQLAGVVLYPFMADNYAGRAAFASFGLLVLALTIFALRATPLFTWVAVLVAAPAVVLLVSSIITNNEKLFPWSAGFEMALYTYASMSMLAYMLSDVEVSADELFAIPAVFTLLAWAFAYLFVIVQALQPGAFGGATGARSWIPAVPVVHHPVEHGPVRHHAGDGARPQRGDAGAAGGRLLHRHGGDPSGLAARSPELLSRSVPVRHRSFGRR